MGLKHKKKRLLDIYGIGGGSGNADFANMTEEEKMQVRKDLGLYYTSKEKSYNTALYLDFANLFDYEENDKTYQISYINYTFPEDIIKTEIQDDFTHKYIDYTFQAYSCQYNGEVQVYINNDPGESIDSGSATFPFADMPIYHTDDGTSYIDGFYIQEEKEYNEKKYKPGIYLIVKQNWDTYLKFLSLNYDDISGEFRDEVINFFKFPTQSNVIQPSLVSDPVFIYSNGDEVWQIYKGSIDLVNGVWDDYYQSYVYPISCIWHNNNYYQACWTFNLYETQGSYWNDQEQEYVSYKYYTTSGEDVPFRMYYFPVDTETDWDSDEGKPIITPAGLYAGSYYVSDDCKSQIQNNIFGVSVPTTTKIQDYGYTETNVTIEEKYIPSNNDAWYINLNDGCLYDYQDRDGNNISDSELKKLWDIGNDGYIVDKKIIINGYGETSINNGETRQLNNFMCVLQYNGIDYSKGNDGMLRFSGQCPVSTTMDGSGMLFINVYMEQYNYNCGEYDAAYLEIKPDDELNY